MMNATLLNREQQRALNAQQAVRQDGSHAPTDYLTHAQSLPTMIRVNGLLPTLAFYQAKKWDNISDALARWLLGGRVPGLVTPANPQGTPTAALIDQLLQLSSRGNRLAELEAEAWSIWLKRFAKGMLDT